MNIKQPQYIRSALALAVCIGLSGPVLAQSAASPSAAAPSVAPKAAQPQVDDKAAQEAEKKAFRAHSGRHHGAHQDPGGFDPP
jgi:hypothetical protein